uniref:UPAR/Ly6 domain-containing protein n=1 Tax=Macrostomum lignano TaxID=282301 RepID=A0A1I8G3C7_9PLAT
MSQLLPAAILFAIAALASRPAVMDAATTTTPGVTATASPTTTSLPGTRIRCYVCDPCDLSGSVTAANAMNDTVCEQCGKSMVGYLGTVTRISRQCYRREDSSNSQCEASRSTDSMQLCCSSGDLCNPAGRTRATLLLPAVLLLQQLARSI